MMPDIMVHSIVLVFCRYLKYLRDKMRFSLVKYNLTEDNSYKTGEIKDFNEIRLA